MHTFSKELIQHTIQYFKATYGHTITEDQADEYLSVMADLFDVFMMIKRHTPPQE